MKQRILNDPVIIIGAARSGTNILRDVLTRLPGLCTWPCDEINYIWRHKNKKHSTDEFTPDMANVRVKNYIRRQFQKMQAKFGCQTIVEKTCANSLRVSFVNEIFPYAKYIFLIRDGRDVVASAMKRWKASLDYKYILKKARYVPLLDTPYYGIQFIMKRLYRIFSTEKRVSSWGPKFEGMAEMLQTRSLAEVCAAQWDRCIQKATKELNTIESNRILLLKYEYFVSHPLEELLRTADFLSITLESDQAERAVISVKNTSVGKWKKKLDKQIIEKIMPYIRFSLLENNYFEP